MASHAEPQRAHTHTHTHRAMILYRAPFDVCVHIVVVLRQPVTHRVARIPLFKNTAAVLIRFVNAAYESFMFDGFRYGP